MSPELSSPKIPKLTLKLKTSSDSYKVVKSQEERSSSDSSNNGWRGRKNVIDDAQYRATDDTNMANTDLELLEADFVSNDAPRTRSRHRYVLDNFSHL